MGVIRGKKISMDKEAYDFCFKAFLVLDLERGYVQLLLFKRRVS
jgi:hypothetical protein